MADELLTLRKAIISCGVGGCAGIIEGPRRESADLDDDGNVDGQGRSGFVSQGLDIVTVLCYTAVTISTLGGGMNVHFDVRNRKTGGVETR